jgi:zinc protease
MLQPSRLLARLGLLVGLLTAPALAQPALDAPLPFDPAVRQGALDNGLHYYIRYNTEPENRAELRLAVDAGSVQEDEDQRGLAHFVEHMAFNGTERYAEPELVRYLESVGTRFGPDLNAYTSFDETVYMLQVPTDSADVFATGIDVLREWAGRITLADSAIERERGVVLEEWRLGQGASERMNRVQYPVLFAESRYAERLPIGLPEVIETAPPERLRAFYRDWYRPDLMAVVVVGDVDVDAVEATIRETFGDLETPADAPAREVYEVPQTGDTRFAIATDLEAPQTVVQLVYKRPPTRERTVGDARADLVDDLFFAALRSRLDEIRQQPGAPFAFAFGGSGSGLRSLDQAFLAALVSDGRIADATQVLVTEAERARRYGITESEFEREKRELLRSLESAVAERENQKSRTLAQTYVQAFLRDQPALAPEARLALAERLLPTITLAEVDAVADELVGAENRVVLVSAPERDDLAVPTEAELAAVLDGVADAELEPYEDAVVDAPLVADPPTPGEIVATGANGDLGTMTWTLSNGATVVLKPTDFKADEVLLYATSPGGTSLLEASDLDVAGGAAGVVGQSGVGAFDQVALQKALSGQIVSLRPVISDEDEGFQGRAAPGDLETLFQLVHLYATAPRRDPDAFQSALDRTRAILENQSVSPRVAFRDTLLATLAHDDPRHRTLTEYLAGLDRADLDASLAFYRDRFADASDFTFVIVGAFEPEAVRSLVETYLASLPSTDREEEPRYFDVRPPPGVVEKTVRAGVEPQAQVAIVFHGPYDAHDRQKRVELSAMRDVLAKALREELREDRGGVYGVSVTDIADRDLEEGRYQIRVTFGADPERVEELTAAVFAEIEALKAGEVEARHLEAYQEQVRRGQETNLQENGYWLGVLVESARRDEPPADLIGEVEVAQRLTMADVEATAREVLSEDQYVRVVLLPVEDAGGTE